MGDLSPSCVLAGLSSLIVMENKMKNRLDGYLEVTAQSSSAFARKLRVSPSWVSLLRRSKARPSGHLAVKIHRATGISLEDLLAVPVERDGDSEEA